MRLDRCVMSTHLTSAYDAAGCRTRRPATVERRRRRTMVVQSSCGDDGRARERAGRTSRSLRAVERNVGHSRRRARRRSACARRRRARALRRRWERRLRRLPGTTRRSVDDLNRARCGRRDRTAARARRGSPRRWRRVALVDQPHGSSGGLDLVGLAAVAQVGREGECGFAVEALLLAQPGSALARKPAKVSRGRASVRR